MLRAGCGHAGEGDGVGVLHGCASYTRAAITSLAARSPESLAPCAVEKKFGEVASPAKNNRPSTGATRCLKRMGLLRGDKVVMRYRRLNMECTRTKTDASIAITRGKDE